MTLFDPPDPPKPHEFVARWDGFCAECGFSPAHAIHSLEEPILDPEEARRLGDEGQERSERHREELAEEFDAACQLACETNEILCADQVWEALGRVLGDHGAASSIGPAMRRARTAGWMVPTDGSRRSQRPANHGKLLPLYRSLIYRSVNA